MDAYGHKGDIVLFYNTNLSVLSLAIKLFSKSKWSHCAMVVRREDGTAWLAEATQTSNIELYPLGLYMHVDVYMYIDVYMDVYVYGCICI